MRKTLGCLYFSNTWQQLSRTVIRKLESFIYGAEECLLSGFSMCLCDASRDLVPFVQLKKLEKQPWRSVTINKVTGGSFL